MDTEGLRRAFSNLEASLAWRGREDARRTLRLIMALNQEIGRLARSWPESEARARELQKRVNLLTLAVKAGRRDDALQALEEAREALSALCSGAKETSPG